MDVAPIVTNGRTLVPVRYMAELLGKAVIWDGTNRKVIIIDTDYILNNIKIKATNLYEYISKIINGELKQDANGGEYSFDFDITYKDPEGKSYNFKFKCDMN
ncbi:MAG: copper amine oxidase N-terminal domain-containing protein [Clostridia bacterium]|nr:copper amine oxidase N-terminal domain-containing protein [Clostridia bacterium]